MKYNFFVAPLSNNKVSLTEKQIILKGMVTNQGVIQKFFLGRGAAVVRRTVITNVMRHS